MLADVNVISGDPPCQGISGFKCFRNKENSFEGLKKKKTNKQTNKLVVFMDIVNYLKPKFVLMENVMDIVKFIGDYLERYALSRLIKMNYQTQIGMMAISAYDLPQFCMSVFI